MQPAARRALTGLVVAACLAVLAPLSSAAPSALRLVGEKRLSPRLSELTFATSAFAAPTRARVLLPDGYSRSARRYPVLFLLNGGAGSYLDWTTLGDAERATAGVPLVVVMPDGGTGGNYTDWYGDDGSGQRPLWETFHVAELLPWVDARYRTTGAHAVAGMSMGGTGALHYAARHPDLFAAAASFSGAVDVLDPVMTPITETTGVIDGALPGAVFGPRLTQEIRWRASNPIDLAGNLRSTWVSLATGNGEAGGPDGGGQDPTERIVHAENVALHDRMTALGIRHRWDDYGPGGHVWFYWKRELRDVLPSLVRVLGPPRKAPVSLTHWAVEPSYDVWGWSVRFTRPVLEASTLQNATSHGFTLSGSGRATVTTPAVFAPGRPLTVTVVDATGSHRSVVRPRHKRLAVTVDLGPANALQQYTVPTQSLGTTVRQARVSIS
jgi:S-formylglutathione hydrolase FrmB